MHTTTLLLVAVLAGGIGAADAVAQEGEHQEHHSGAAAEATQPAAPPAAMEDQKTYSGVRQPGMGGRHMEMMRHCMKMMRNMDPDEHAVMRERMMGSRGMSHGGMMDDDDMAAGPDDPVEGAFAAINRRMHEDMAVPVGESADVAFAEAMIPHHQGAIDMARVILGFGKDPEIRKVAEDVIAAQEREIAFLQQWLAKQPKSDQAPQ
jgi:uncharacterized protein (DUF305 family)